MFLIVILKDMLLNLNSAFSVSDAVKKKDWMYCMTNYDFSMSEFTFSTSERFFSSIINISLYIITKVKKPLIFY